MRSDANAPLIAFVCYTAIVLGLAVLSNYAFKKRAFVSEYFLGSRGLGVIALALTFGATSASAGSFAGFPSLIYAHGWSLALWIASYMIFPLCGMGLLGKRLSIVSRRTGAITLPDIPPRAFRKSLAGAHEYDTAIGSALCIPCASVYTCSTDHAAVTGGFSPLSGSSPLASK